MKLDYEAMYEALLGRVNELLKADEEYFALMSVITEKSKFIEVATKNILKLPKSAQLKYFRCVAESSLTAEALCRQYNLLVEEPGEVEEPKEDEE